jgi:hypothetical protein
MTYDNWIGLLAIAATILLAVITAAVLNAKQIGSIAQGLQGLQDSMRDSVRDREHIHNRIDNLVLASGMRDQRFEKLKGEHDLMMRLRAGCGNALPDTQTGKGWGENQG